jgi:hypothetical protein
MIDAGVEALLSSFSEEFLSWRTPGLSHGVAQAYRAMQAFSVQEGRGGGVKKRSSSRF